MGISCMQGKRNVTLKSKFLNNIDKAGLFPNNLIRQEIDIYLIFIFLQDRVIVNFSSLTRSSGTLLSCGYHDRVWLSVYVHAQRLRVFAAKCLNRIKFRCIKGIAINENRQNRHCFIETQVQLLNVTPFFRITPILIRYKVLA